MDTPKQCVDHRNDTYGMSSGVHTGLQMVVLQLIILQQLGGTSRGIPGLGQTRRIAPARGEEKGKGERRRAYEENAGNERKALDT